MPETQPGKLLDSQGQPLKHQARVRFDLTINIPTLITVVGLFMSGAVYAVTLVNDINRRTDRNTYDLAIAQDRIKAVEGQISQARLDGNSNVQSLRGEIRVDLLEIKGTLKDLMLRQGQGGGRNLQDWSR